MLYLVGPLEIDTFPFSLDEVDDEVTADYAKHPLISRRKGYEAVGVGDETLTLSGECLPYHIGGLPQIELAKALCRAQGPVFVMRGDGGVAGWYVLTKVRARHGGKTPIGPTGVGYVVKHELVLECIDDPGEAAGGDLLGTVAGIALSLF